jgi:hypothetical protein
MTKLFNIPLVAYTSAINEKSNTKNQVTLDTHLCRRCGKPITDDNSITLGMGPICYAKYLCEICQEKDKKLF